MIRSNKRVVVCETVLVTNIAVDSLIFIYLCVLLFQALTSTALKKGGVHAADVTTQYKYKNAVFDVKIDTDSTVTLFTISIIQ